MPWLMTRDLEEFRDVLRLVGGPGDLAQVERMAFYEEASGSDVAVAVVSGETRLYANLLLRIGVVWPAAMTKGRRP